MPGVLVEDVLKPVFLALISLMLVACAAPAQPAAQISTDPPVKPPKKMTFMAGYKAQANLPFVGVYIAQEKGYFAEQNLTVDIQHSANGEHPKLLATGQIQVSTANADAVLKNIADPGLPLVAIALFGQRGDQVYASLKDSGITSPKDWEGKVVGYKVRPSPDYLAMLQKFNVDRSKIKEVSVGYDPRILIEKRVDVYPMFRSNEPDTLQRLGFETTLIDAADYGVATLGVTYITTQDLIARDPDLLTRFVKAAMRGVAYAVKNPDEATDIVMKYAPDEDRAHQRYMLGVEIETATSDLTRAQGYGAMTAQQWQALYDTLIAYGGLAKPFDPKEAYNVSILQSVYHDGTLLWP